MPPIGDLLARIKAIIGLLTSTAVTTVGTTATIMAYVKGILNQLALLVGVTPAIVRNTFTFSTLTTGKVGAHTVFTVTGCVFIKRVTAYCTTSVTEAVAGATIMLGLPGNYATYIDATDAELILAGTLWSRSTSPAGTGSHNVDFPYLCNLVTTADIAYQILTQALSGGVIVFIVEWYPLSSDGNLVAATPA